uniref:Sodium channel blocker AbNaTx22 n=1 Tax=Androctonus bicolor TaxID=748906 RepID=A0A0K0LBV9_9SCOR|nr:sodium channel blocker AbNaTx22 [Androctonus bicolor]
MRILNYYLFSAILLAYLGIYKAWVQPKIKDGYYLSDENGVFVTCKFRYNEYFCLEECVENGAKDGYCVGNASICFCKHEIGNPKEHSLF